MSKDSSDMNPPAPIGYDGPVDLDPHEPVDHLSAIRDILTEIRDALAGEEPCTPDEWRAYSAYAAEMAKAEPVDDFLADAPRVPGLDDPEPVDVTEDQPCGSQATDKDGEIWRRRERGWVLVEDEDGPGCTWGSISHSFGPLRLTTDADRERVGLPTERIKVTRDSAIGQLLERNGVKFPDDMPAVHDPAPDERRVNVVITDVYATSDEYGYLRINVGPETAVIDPSATNVTVTDVDTAPDPDERIRVYVEMVERAEKAEAEVKRLTRERDEARERAEGVTAILEDRVAFWREEKILANDAALAYLDRAEKAEADLSEEVDEHNKTRATVLRLTRERDDLRARVDELIRERGQAIERAEYAEDRCETTRQALLKAEAEEARLEAINDEMGKALASEREGRQAEVERLTRERDDAIGRSVTSRSALVAEREHRASLRGDVALYATHWVRRFGSMDRAEVVAVMNGILARDDEQGAK